jgi:predicted Fe-Mo cluster-binding NifX family protein
MKIAINTNGTDLDAAVDPRFGRCPGFLIVDTEDLASEAMENPGAGRGQGAGIQTAEWVAQKGGAAVLTGNCGPKAHRALTAAGITVVTGCTGTAREAIARFMSGELPAAARPNVPGHFGDKTPPAEADRAAAAFGAGRGMGRGSGRGMGRGGGGGRGMGRGRGFMPVKIDLGAARSLRRVGADAAAFHRNTDSEK